jgi:hypothetical protein
MIGIITCIRHPKSAKNFNRIRALLIGTLRTLENQTSKEFKFYIVCNKGSDISIESNINYEVIEVSIDCPESVEVVDDITEEAFNHTVRKDKGSKYYFGLQQARNDCMDYVMFIDADDFLHCNVVEYIEKNRNIYDGLIVDKGYSYSNTSRFLGEMRKFNKTCGTCNSYSMKILDKYILPDKFKCQGDMLDLVNNDFIFKVLGSHLNGVEFVKSENGKVDFFPFYASIYLIDNGENVSNNNSIIGRPISLNVDAIESFALDADAKNSLGHIMRLIIFRFFYFSKPLFNKFKKTLVRVKRNLLGTLK